MVLGQQGNVMGFPWMMLGSLMSVAALIGITVEILVRRDCARNE